MNILVTGANGFLGQHLVKHLSDAGYSITAASRGERRIPPDIPIAYYSIELTDIEAVATLVKQTNPQIIIHTAANSKPDECEKDKASCLKNNVDVTQYLLEALKSTEPPGKLFIYLSTDFIFGENGPHEVEDAKSPLNFYGASKLMAEELVANSGLPYAVVRPVFIYGPVWPGLRPSFLHWIKNSLEAGKPIKVVSDQLRTPTYVYDICKGIESLIKQRKTGIYHLAGKDVLSPYDMAVTTAAVLGLDISLVESVTSETFPEPVQRAKRSGLKIGRAQSELEYEPVSFAEGVRETFRV